MKTNEKITSEVVCRVFFGSNSENLIINRDNIGKISIAHELVSVI